jgi:uncharacterized protein
MLIDIRTLARQAGTSMELDLEIGPEAFGLLREDLSLESPVAFAGQLTHTDHGILILTGTRKATLTGICGRCLQPVPLMIETSLNETFEPDDEKSGSGSDEEQPSEAYGHTGLALEIDQALRDNLIPLLPARLICREDCAGLCPVCGTDRNANPCDCLSGGKGKPSPFDALKQLL